MILNGSGKMHIKLIKELKAFNSFRLIRKLSALRLMPENADYHLRLDALCHYCASIAPDPNKKEGNESELEDLCNNLDSLDLEFLDYEYPSENLFTENIHFVGGGYIVFPGISINGSFQLRLILRGLNLVKLSHGESKFMNHIEEVVLTILSLSDSMLKKAGLNYGVIVSSDSNHKIKIPSKHNLERLTNSVTFTMAELLKTEISIEILNEFCFELGSTKEKYVPDQTILNLKPLTKYQGNIIVTSPHLIISSLIHYIFLKLKNIIV